MDKDQRLRYFMKKWNFLIFLYIATLFIIIFAVESISDAQLKVGDISPRTYTATRDIENEVATKRNRELAKAEVETIYVIDETKNQSIFKKTDDFFKGIEHYRNTYKAEIEAFEKQKDEDTENSLSKDEILNNNISELVNFLKSLEYQVGTLAKSDIEYILTLSSSDYLTFKTIVESTVKTSTEYGITNAMYENGEFYDNSYGVSSIYETMLINNIVHLLVVPNVSVDVDATASAMETAVNNVQPVMYFKEQTIVSAGEIVNDEQLQVLTKLNLVGNLVDLNYFVIFLYAVILGIIYWIIGLVFDKNQNEKFLAGNYKVLYSFLNITMLSAIVLMPTEINSIFSPLFLYVFLLASIYNSHIAFVMSVLYTIVCMLLDKIIPAETVFFLLSSMFIANIIVRDIERFKLAKTSTVISLVAGATYFVTYTIMDVSLATGEQIVLNTLVIMLFIMLSMILAYGIIPFLEVTFNLITSHRLQDLLNQDKPIFQRMLAETPGTLHHAVVVSNLCAAGAKAVGADEKLAKVYGYYHDIGKLSAPMYFIENQIGYNFHDDLEYVESARVIKNHVAYGLELRKEYKLPKLIDEAILAHHGTSIIQYFYNMALNDEKIEDVDILDYTYDGVKPVSKELTILMIADIVEAGVRSIIPKSKDIGEVEDFIDKIIDGKIKEGQFDESELTFGDIKKVKQAFLAEIKSMYHNRISYPSEE